MTDQPCVVINAALRFARSNPELVRYARAHLNGAGTTVDDLLMRAIERVVAVRDAECEQAFSTTSRPLLRAL